MTKEQQAAARALAALLGVPQRPQIPKELAGRVLAEALDSMAGTVRFTPGNKPIVEQVRQGVANTFDASTAIALPKPAPKGSELEKLTAYLAGTDVVEQPPQPSAGHVASEPSAEMQEAIDKAVERALAKHGISTGNTDEE